jgi:hypothetical protein
MKVHLIPSNDLNDELYTRVLSLLQAVPGVNKFIPNGSGRIRLPEDMQEDQEIPDKEAFEKKRFTYAMSTDVYAPKSRRTWTFPHIRRAVRWTDLFSEIQEYREESAIPDGQFVILLTPTANKKNWFALLDEKRPYNGFIHTDEWEHYMSCDPAIPIAFEVVALTLQKHIFTRYADVERLTHERAIGCVSDLCMKKTDIILKMRTADICPDCMSRVQSQLSMPEIHHALSVLESLRIKMLYSQNFKQNSSPSRLKIGKGNRLFLVDYENIEVRMPAMEKTLYLFFLRHPEGINISMLRKDRKELIEIYKNVSTRGRLEDMDLRMNTLLNTLNEQISIKISRIKKAFTDAIGASLADHYIIQGPNAEKKLIKLDRNLVIETF